MDFLSGLFGKDKNSIELREREQHLKTDHIDSWTLIINESGITGQEKDPDEKIKKLKDFIGPFIDQSDRLLVDLELNRDQALNLYLLGVVVLLRNGTLKHTGENIIPSWKERLDVFEKIDHQVMLGYKGHLEKNLLAAIGALKGLEMTQSLIDLAKGTGSTDN